MVAQRETVSQRRFTGRSLWGGTLAFQQGGMAHVNRGVDRSAAVAAAGMLLAVATAAVAAEFRRAVEQAESAYADGRLGEAVERYTHANHHR